MPDDLTGIVSGIIAVIILITFLGSMIAISSQFGEERCQPYKDTISQKDRDIATSNVALNQTGDLLNQCRAGYERLIKENITKKDIEEIKGYYNLTQIQINSLNQKFDVVNQNYFNFYKVLLNNYRLSLTFNFAVGFTLLGFEVLSLVFLKSELVLFAIRAAIKHRAKKKEEQNV